LSDDLSTTYTLVGLIEGATYRFTVRAANIYGPGPDSPISSVVASDIPDRMDPITTSRVNTDIITSFLAPADNGATLLEYEIVILHKTTGVYSVDISKCDGVVSSLSCTWPIAYLMSNYAYATGDLPLFKARARNIDGWGEQSNPNSGGATIMTVPAAVTAPTEGSSTSHTQIETYWTALTALADIGGTDITSYALEWDQGSGTWVTLKGDPVAVPG
jgi:hypothetical protein